MNPLPSSRPAASALSRLSVPGLVTAQAVMPSRFGPLLLARTARGLAGVWFTGQKHHPPVLAAPQVDDEPLLARATAQLARHFDGEPTVFDLPLDLRGTPFQRAVWAALLEIPRGTTCSYGAVARAVGLPAAVRAVGGAIGRNPVSVIVPCHRVVGSSGALTGYAGGLARKRALLALEMGRAATIVTAAHRAAADLRSPSFA